MTKEQARNQFYVQIREPEELRRRILEASKSTIHGLQGYHAFLAKRERKLAIVAQLKKEVQEIIILHTKLSAALPALELPPERPKHVASHKKTPVKKATRPAPKRAEKPHKKTELEKLDDMLSAVEKKLSNV